MSFDTLHQWLRSPLRLWRSPACLMFDCPERHGFLYVPVPSCVVCGEANRESSLTKICWLRSRRLWESRASQNPFAKPIRTKQGFLLIGEVFQRPARQNKHPSGALQGRLLHVPADGPTPSRMHENCLPFLFRAACASSLSKTYDDGQSVRPNARERPARTVALGCCRARARCWSLQLRNRG